MHTWEHFYELFITIFRYKTSVYYSPAATVELVSWHMSPDNTLLLLEDMQSGDAIVEFKFDGYQIHITENGQSVTVTMGDEIDYSIFSDSRIQPAITSEFAYWEQYA